MASTQGEIRVGPSHQARLPELRASSSDLQDRLANSDLDREPEELRWIPGMTLDTDLRMYLRAARSMAAFAGMCDGGSPDDGCVAASRDDTTINALDVLHDSGYDPGKALQALVKCPVPKGIDKKWSEEETKRFVKGLRQFGKNFFRIRKDLLPHKDTPELVEFYYLWKKTPGANNNRPHRRNRRQGSLRRIRNTRNTRGQPKETEASSPVAVGSSRPSPNPKEQGEGSTASEDDNSEDDSDSRDHAAFRCQHCYSTSSRDWQHVGKERVLLCSECRAYSKKYGELPAVNNNAANGTVTPNKADAPYLFRPVQNEGLEDSAGRMRTRTRAKEQVKPDTPTKGRKRAPIEADAEEEKDMSLFKRKRNERADSPAESLTTDSGSLADDAENNDQENDTAISTNNRVIIQTNDGQVNIDPLHSIPSRILSESPIQGIIGNGQAIEDSQSTSSIKAENILPCTTDHCTGSQTSTSSAVVIVSNIKNLASETGLLGSSPIPVTGTKCNINGVDEHVEEKMEEEILSVQGDIKGSLERDIMKIPTQLGFDSQNDELTSGENSNLENSMLSSNIEEDPLSLIMKHEIQQDASERSGNENPNNLYSGNKRNEEMTTLMKIVIKEEIDNSSDETHNIQMAMPNINLVLKEEPRVPKPQSGQHLSEGTSVMCMTGSSSIHGIAVGSAIKIEPGLLREEQVQSLESGNTIQTSSSSISADLSPMQITSAMMQMPPNMPNTSQSLTSINLSHHTVCNEPASSLITIPHHLPANSCSSPVLRHSGDIQNSNATLCVEKQSQIINNYSDDSRDSKPPLLSSSQSQSVILQHQSPVLQSINPGSAMLSQNYAYLPNSPYHHHHHHHHQRTSNLNTEKGSGNNITPLSSVNIQQSEPQNLKIKQEVIAPSDQQLPSDPLQSLKEVKIPGFSGANASISQSLTGSGPTGLSGSSCSMNLDSQRPPSDSASIHTFLGPSVENIKKEPDNYIPSNAMLMQNTGSKSPPSSKLLQANTAQPHTENGSVNITSCTPPLNRITGTPPVSSNSQTPVSHSTTTLISPSPVPARLTPTSLSNGQSALQQPVIHPSQQTSPLNRSSPSHSHGAPHPHSTHPHASPFIGPPGSHPALHHHHAHHSLIHHHPLFAAAAVHHHSPYHPPHPYATAYGYPFPYPYGPPIPQPHPVPPPHHSTPPASTLVASSNSSSSSSHGHRSSHEQNKVEARTASAVESTTTSMHTSHHSSHSSSVTTRREISSSSDDISNSVSTGGERHHHTQELTTTHHSSHHSSVHHQLTTEKQSSHQNQQPVNHTITISHSSSSSSSASVQHKISSGGKSNPANVSSPSCHVSATLTSSTSSSTSISLPSTNHGNHHHSHHHSHSHSHHHQHHHQSSSGERLSPNTGMVIPSSLNVQLPISQSTTTTGRTHHSSSSNHQHQSHSHHSKLGTSSSTGSVSHHHPNHPSLMVQPSLPPAIGHHPISLGLPPSGMPGSSLEALRAHAQAAASIQQQQQQHSQGPISMSLIHSSPHSPLSLSSQGPTSQPSHTGLGAAGSHLSSSRHLIQGLPDELKSEPLSDLEQQLSVPQQTEEEEVPSPNHIPRGPSPEPKIEDTDCHRSQSAIFLRHWNRGDFNSCARTDLTFKPVPDSKLARKREERLRKQAEREREEREKAAAQAQTRKIATPEKPEGTKPPSRGPIESISSPYERFTPRQGYPDTPALRQLSEYARPHAGFSPGTLPRSSGLGLPPQCIDPMLHYQIYGPGARERLELEHLEREKREREMRELRERELSDRIKDELMKNVGAGPRVANLDAHWLEIHRRYTSLAASGPHPQFGIYSPSPTHQAALSQLERERLERLGIPTAPGPHGPPPVGPAGPHAHPHPGSVAALEAAERLALATDPMVRLQMAGISPEYHAHTHAHTHAHSHTHLHLHPSQQAQQAQAQQDAAGSAAGFPLPASAGSSYPRPSLLPPREAGLGLHHPSDILGRGPGYADQLAHQLSAQAVAHEQLQRQILLERERFPHPHPSLVVQHEEYLRQQREREMKVRALEEAARGSRP